jgi:hypothetical protein
MTAAKATPTDPEEYARAVEKVKARVARWPNAYASGQVVIEYKRAMKEKGRPPYKAKAAAAVPREKTALARWYAEDWRDIKTGAPCGAVHTAAYYPTCRPAKRVTEQSPVPVTDLSAAEVKRMISQKQKAKEATVSYRETEVAKKRRSRQKKEL